MIEANLPHVLHWLRLPQPMHGVERVGLFFSYWAARKWVLRPESSKWGFALEPNGLVGGWSIGFYETSCFLTVKVLESLPNAEWRLIFSLSRFGG